MAQSTRATVAQLIGADELELSTLQEAVYGTPLATGSITKHFPVAAPLAVEALTEKQTNENETGRSTEWADYQYDIMNSFKLPVKWPLSSDLLAWCAAFGLGKVTTADNTGSYTHTFVQQDRTATIGAGNGDRSHPASTSIRYQNGPLQKIAAGICVAKFTINGKMNAVPDLSADLVGSGLITTDANPFQTIARPNLMRLSQVQLGVADSEQDITKGSVTDLAFTWDSGLKLDEVAASGLNLAQIMMDMRKWDLTLKMRQHSTDTEDTNWRANTLLQAILTFKGAVIHDAYYHQAVITLHGLRIGSIKIGASGIHKVNELTLNPMADGSGNYITIAVTNGQANYLTLEA